LLDRNESLLVGWSSGGNSEVLISSKSVKRFHSCGGRNVPFPIDFGLQEVILRFLFHQNWLSIFVAVRGRNLPFPVDLAESMEYGQIN